MGYQIIFFYAGFLEQFPTVFKFRISLMLVIRLWEKISLVFEEITGVLCSGLRRIGNNLVGAPWDCVYIFADDD